MQFIIVRGNYSWSPINSCVYKVHGIFETSAYGSELESEMFEYAKNQFENFDNLKNIENTNIVTKYYKNMMTQESENPSFIIEHTLERIFYGFIRINSIIPVKSENLTEKFS